MEEQQNGDDGPKRDNDYVVISSGFQLIQGDNSRPSGLSDGLQAETRAVHSQQSSPSLPSSVIGAGQSVARRRCRSHFKFYVSSSSTR